MRINFSSCLSRQPVFHSGDLSHTLRRVERERFLLQAFHHLLDGPVLEPQIPFSPSSSGLPWFSLPLFCLHDFFCFRFRTRALKPCLHRTRVSSRLFHSSSLGQGLCRTPGPLAEAPCLPVLMLQSRGYRCSTSLLGSTHLSSQDFLLLQR